MSTDTVATLALGAARRRRRGAKAPIGSTPVADRGSRPSLRRILVVEDDPDTQILVGFALKRAFEVKTCGTGLEALATVSRFEPDLVLLDVMLPFMDGPTVLREMRADERLPAVPVVFMTARAFPEELASYRALGALDVIVKPFDPMTLAETLSSIWTRWHRGRGKQAADS